MDLLAGFNPHELRQPITPREIRLAEAAKLAGVKAYNFFEIGEWVKFNTKWLRNGEEWVCSNQLDIRTIDALSTVALSELVAVDPHTISEVSK